MTSINSSLSAWWYNNHLEKWWSSSVGKDYIPYMKWKITNVPNHQPANAAVAVLEHFTILPNWKCYPYSSYDKGERFQTSIYGDRNIPTFASEKYPLLCGHQSHIRILKSPHSKFQLPGLNSLTSVFSNEPNRWRSGTIKITCLSNESRCFVSMGNQDTRASFFCGTWFCQLFNKSDCDEVKTTINHPMFDRLYHL